MPGSDHPRGRGRWKAGCLGAATLAYACLLVWATHHPQPQDLLGRNPPSDKLLHFGAYAILGGLGAATVAAAGRLTPRGAIATAIGLAAFAAIDEVTQPLPWFGRTADPVDWLYDSLGIAIGMLAGAVLAAAIRGPRGRAPA